MTTRDELIALADKLANVTYSPADTLPRLDTLRLTDALLYVDRKMVEMGVTE